MNQTQATLIGFGVVALMVAVGFWGLKRSVDRGVDRMDRTLANLPNTLVNRILPSIPR
ncbi:hypothetical protein [Meiothermus sp. CFH 77666]|uniref:hypothetical protein n=1 Tax=Meiothermus sp. CFH 77666 TaxID=2817942 RepID=UPI001AA0A676|nr:hypothetical protein [Meiothermus sp. CFH 77666]MBO1438347.1 hypothetical protein [Meiothermus sp. CFH 77666]